MDDWKGVKRGEKGEEDEEKGRERWRG